MYLSRYYVHNRFAVYFDVNLMVYKYVASLI